MQNGSGYSTAISSFTSMLKSSRMNFPKKFLTLVRKNFPMFALEKVHISLNFSDPLFDESGPLNHPIIYRRDQKIIGEISFPDKFSEIGEGFGYGGLLANHDFHLDVASVFLVVSVWEFSFCECQIFLTQEFPDFPEDIYSWDISSPRSHLFRSTYPARSCPGALRRPRSEGLRKVKHQKSREFLTFGLLKGRVQMAIWICHIQGD